jgi:hypothetical protein
MFFFWMSAIVKKNENRKLKKMDTDLYIYSENL